MATQADTFHSLSNHQPGLSKSESGSNSTIPGATGPYQSNLAAVPDWKDPDQAFQGQEVTQYCPIEGCPFVPFKTYDKAMLGVYFEMLKMHMKVEHSLSDSDTGVATSRDKTSREYQAATRPRTITNVMDDATFNLCEARFFPFPLDMQVIGRNMPTTISPINTVVDVSHFGVDVTNSDVLKKLHNRANNSLRLKEYSDSNLRHFHEAGDIYSAGPGKPKYCNSNKHGFHSH